MLTKDKTYRILICCSLFGTFCALYMCAKSRIYNNRAIVILITTMVANCILLLKIHNNNSNL